MLLKDPEASVPLTLLSHLTACSNLTLKLVITQQQVIQSDRDVSTLQSGIGMVMGSPSLTTGCSAPQAATSYRLFRDTTCYRLLYATGCSVPQAACSLNPQCTGRHEHTEVTIMKSQKLLKTDLRSTLEEISLQPCRKERRPQLWGSSVNWATEACWTDLR